MLNKLRGWLGNYFRPAAKNTVFYSATEPKASRFYSRNRRRIGDMWFDTSNRHKIYIFDGTRWKPLLPKD